MAMHLPFFSEIFFVKINVGFIFGRNQEKGSFYDYRKTATSSIRHTTIYALPRIRRDFPNLKLFAATYEELANQMTS